MVFTSTPGRGIPGVLVHLKPGMLQIEKPGGLWYHFGSICGTKRFICE